MTASPTAIGSGHVLVTDWNGDNQGPSTVAVLKVSHGLQLQSLWVIHTAAVG